MEVRSLHFTRVHLHPRVASQFTFTSEEMSQRYIYTSFHISPITSLLSKTEYLRAHRAFAKNGCMCAHADACARAARANERWSSDMSTSWSGSAEGGSAAWPSPRMAQPKRQSVGARWRVGGRCSRGGGDVAVLHRELDGRARVRRVLLRAGEVREVLAREPRRPLLTALETVSGPGYCLITSMPMDWSVVFCAEEVFLAGGMRAEAVDGRCTPYSHAPPV